MGGSSWGYKGGLLGAVPLKEEDARGFLPWVLLWFFWSVSVCLSVCLFVCRSICLGLSVSVCVRLRLAVSACVCLCVCVCLCLSGSVSVCLYLFGLFIAIFNFQKYPLRCFFPAVFSLGRSVSIPQFAVYAYWVFS